MNKWLHLGLRASLLVWVFAIAACNQPEPAKSWEPANPHAIVDQTFTGAAGTEVNGVRTFAALQSALDDAPSDAKEPYVIFVKNGTYYEKLRIDKPYITLIGQDREQTVLTFDDAAGKGSAGEPVGTSGSASVTVKGRNFRAENLTISNGFDYMGNAAKPDSDPTKVQGSQAVALKTEYGADQAYFEHVKILGYQDTLYVNDGKVYFKDCYIAGNVDFIFGGAQAVFDNCDIVSLDRGSDSGNGFITAASTSDIRKYGFLILNSRLLKEHPGMADHSVALGRPWHPSGDPRVNSYVVFMNCYMDSHISAKGWEPMSGFQPEDSRFYEYGSTGPGAIKSDTRRIMTDSEAAAYNTINVLGGWDPSTVEKIERQ